MVDEFAIDLTENSVTFLLYKIRPMNYCQANQKAREILEVLQNYTTA